MQPKHWWNSLVSVCYLSCTCESFASCSNSIFYLLHICLLHICLLHICLFHICSLHICLLPCLEGVPPHSDVLGDSLFGGSAPMAASHQVLLSPSTYIALGVFIIWRWPVGGCHGYPSLFAFFPHFAHCLLCSQLAPTLHYRQVKWDYQ